MILCVRGQKTQAHDGRADEAIVDHAEEEGAWLDFEVEAFTNSELQLTWCHLYGSSAD